MGVTGSVSMQPRSVLPSLLRASADYEPSAGVPFAWVPRHRASYSSASYAELVWYTGASGYQCVIFEFMLCTASRAAPTALTSGFAYFTDITPFLIHRGPSSVRPGIL